MLNASAAVVIHVLLDLALALPRRRLVDRHLDRLLVVSDDGGSQCGILRVELSIVHRPEPVEHQVLLIPAEVLVELSFKCIYITK